VRFHKGICAGLGSVLLLAQAQFLASSADTSAPTQSLNDHTTARTSTPLKSISAILDRSTRHVELEGLDVFIPDNYRGPLPILVKGECFGASQTPAIAVDSAAYGPDASLINITQRPGSFCSSYQVTADLVSPVAQGGTAAGAPATDATAGISQRPVYRAPAGRRE
jgi:hypothetical protein